MRQLHLSAATCLYSLRWFSVCAVPRRYGYDYPCQGEDADTPAAADADLCRLQPVAFQDVSCSDAAGAQRCYYEIMAREWPSSCLCLCAHGKPACSAGARGVCHMLCFNA